MHAKLTLPASPAPVLMRDELALRDTDFESLYRREYPAMFGVASALVGADAEDLVHDAMLQALLRWAQVRRLDRPGGWCHRVLVNRCRSWWRRKRTREAYLARQLRTEPSTPGPSTETVAFWAAVRELPLRPRLVVTLHYAGDRSVTEVARILEVPEGTVRSDLTRARVALGRSLGV